LKHFVLVHDVKDLGNLKELIETAEKNEERKTAFRNYVEKLRSEMKTGKISPEDYRESMMKWCRDKSEESRVGRRA